MKYKIRRIEDLPFFNWRMKWLLKKQSRNFQPGKYRMGRGIIANVDEEYLTKSESRYELHHKYADLVVMLEGQEEIHLGHASKLTLVEAYDASRDIAFYADDGQGKKVAMNRGDFLLVHPGVAHMPGMMVNQMPSLVFKVVFKIPQRLLRNL